MLVGMQEASILDVPFDRGRQLGLHSKVDGTATAMSPWKIGLWWDEMGDLVVGHDASSYVFSGKF